MSESLDPHWRYGVILFPLPPLLSLIALGSLRAFISLSLSGTGSETDALVGLATFVLSVLSFWLAVLIAVVVAVSVYLDARAFAGHDTWSPNRYVFGGIGLIHLAGTEFLVLNLLTVPSFLYYIHQRRQNAS